MLARMSRRDSELPIFTVFSYFQIHPILYFNKSATKLPPFSLLYVFSTGIVRQKAMAMAVLSL